MRRLPLSACPPVRHARRVARPGISAVGRTAHRGRGSAEKRHAPRRRAGDPGPGCASRHPGGVRSQPLPQPPRTNVTFMSTRYAVTLPSSTTTFCSLTQALSMFWTVSAALAIPSLAVAAEGLSPRLPGRRRVVRTGGKGRGKGGGASRDAAGRGRRQRRLRRHPEIQLSGAGAAEALRFVCGVSPRSTPDVAAQDGGAGWPPSAAVLVGLFARFLTIIHDLPCRVALGVGVPA